MKHGSNKMYPIINEWKNIQTLSSDNVINMKRTAAPKAMRAVSSGVMLCFQLYRAV